MQDARSPELGRDLGPDLFELGTLPYELLAGTTAAIDFIAGLDPDATGSRRDRIVSSLTSVERYDASLAACAAVK